MYKGRIARFDQGKVGTAIGDQADLVARLAVDNGCRQGLASRLMLPRDPIEVLSEDLIAKELHVEVGFVTLVRPISKWWGRMEKKEERKAPENDQAA